MTSKNLFFKLMKKDFCQRLWAVALISLGCFFAYPVTAAIEAGNIERYESLAEGLADYTREILTWLSFENGMTVFAMIGAAVICGISSFSWLNSRTKVDFYHSIPVRRELLFAADFMNGILIMAVPYLVSMVAAACIAVGNGVDGGLLWPVVLSACGLHLTYFILLYSTVVVAVMLTGNMIVAFLGCIVFAGAIPLAVAIVQAYFMSFFHTACWESWNHLVSSASRFSPVAEYVISVGTYERGISMVPRVLGALSVSAVLTALSCFLYKKRPSEAAGKAMAFPVSKPIIRILIVMLSALGMGVFFWAIQESFGWAVFGILCGSVIAHCTIEIIYHFDFKKLFSHPVQLAGCILTSVAVLCVFRYDMFGYDTYLPEEGKVRHAAVSVDRHNNWVSYGWVKKNQDGSYQYENGDWSAVLDKMEIHDIPLILNLAAAGVEQVQEQNEKDRSRDVAVLYSGEENCFSTVNICYTLNSGRKVYRRYNMDINRCQPLFDKLFASEEYGKGCFPVMNKTGEEVADIRWRSGEEEMRLTGLSTEEKEELLEAYKKEFSALTVEDMKYEIPVGLIRFTRQIDVDAMNWANYQAGRERTSYYYRYSDDLERRDYYPVYSSFKKTCSLLRKHGISPDGYFQNKELGAVNISRWNEKKQVRESVTIEDPLEIKELNKLMTISGMEYYNDFYLSESNLEVSYYDKATDRYVYTSMPEGKVPDFVYDRMKPAE